jgi:hypothetical protein
MPESDLQIQVERTAQGHFVKGQSGNPAGKPPGGPPSEDQNTLRAARRGRDTMTQAAGLAAPRFRFAPSSTLQYKFKCPGADLIPLMRNLQYTGPQYSTGLSAANSIGGKISNTL